MTLTPLRLAGITLLCLAASGPGRADSTASSAASAGSASLGSASNSLQGSSNASSRNTAVAAGDYRVVEVAALAERPGMLRLKMQPVAAAGTDSDIWLVLPQQALGQRALVAGDLVNARPRDYGVEFARLDGANGREAFFLVLADDWHRELDPRAVRL